MEHWLKRCAECGSESLREERIAEQRQTVAEVSFVTEVPALKCAQCGEIYFEGPVLEALDLGIAAELARLGRRTPEAFRYMRKVLGLRAVDLAELLDVTSDTVSRWERGAVDVDHAAFAVLGALVAERRVGKTDMQDRLKAARDPKVPTKPIKVVAA